MNKDKKVKFSEYNLIKWKLNDEKYMKTYRSKKEKDDVIDMREKNIEEEVINNYENSYSKKEICSHRMSNRDMIIQGLINPYMYSNNYLDDLKNQDTYLRPQDSNDKRQKNI